jgi:hypothetical protein
VAAAEVGAALVAFERQLDADMARGETTADEYSTKILAFYKEV